jgi:hypothetical protein
MLTGSGAGSGFGTANIHIGNITLPSVANARQFVEEINRMAANGGAKIDPRAIGR